MPRKDKLVLKSAPRSLPWTTKSSLLLGGWVSFVGWILIGMAFMRFLIYLPDIHFGLDEYTEGKITHIERTDDTESAYRNHFSFSNEDKLYKGSTLSIDKQYTKGDEVGIEFKYSNPEKARIEGHSLWNAMNLTPAAFAIIGLILIIIRIRKGASAIAMLKNGHLAWATLVDKSATKVSVEKHRVYKMTFEYRDQHDYRHRIITKTHVTEELEDDPEEPVLFNPNKPENAILLDQWELYASCSNKGEFKDELRFYGIFNTCLPLIGLTAYSILILSRLHW